jgi:DNA-binding transcriptional MerR regulator
MLMVLAENQERENAMARMPEIPNKLYFRIGEVSDLVGVRPYVLRYWESEFPDIKPSKSKSGQRLYKRRDVEQLVRIRQLLYEERFTIDGARKRLKELSRSEFAKPVETQTAKPKQLEVFEEPQTVKQEALPNAQGFTGDRKVFAKLKRDLESLLVIVKK